MKLAPAIAFFAAVAISTAAVAEQADMQSICGDYSNAARIVMDARQHGVPMANMMAETKGQEPYKTMVMQAYGMTAYRTSEYQNRSVNEFADRWYLSCVRYLETKK